MGPQSDMQSVGDRNVGMRRMTVFLPRRVMYQPAQTACKS